MSFNYLQSEIKLWQDACQRLMLHPKSLPQEQAAKTSMVSEVRIQVFSIMHYLGGCGYYLHMTVHATMKLEKHYTCWIERDGEYLTNPLSQGWLLQVS